MQAKSERLTFARYKKRVCMTESPDMMVMWKISGLTQKIHPVGGFFHIQKRNLQRGGTRNMKCNRGGFTYGGYF